MPDTINFNMQMDKQLKTESEVLFQNLGMNLTTAINVFLRQAVRTGGFPFEIKAETPNKETVLALLETEKIQNDLHAKVYNDVEEALEELKK